MQAAAQAKTYSSNDSLLKLAQPVATIGVDLEYGIRAWCALERCYLPNVPPKDLRLVKLLPAIQKLQSVALKCRTDITAKLSKGGEDAEESTSPVALLLNDVERLKGLLAICEPSDANRSLYMNAWTYHYLKKCVLTITNTADYQYLDMLMVTDTEMQTYGNLYLQSVDALDKYGEERPKHLVEPRVYWPPREPSPKLTLDDLIGLESGGDKPVARQGAMSESFGGMRLVTVEKVQLECKRATVVVSDAGLLGATPNMTVLEIRWKGSRSGLLAVVVRTKSHRTWTLEDRAAHAKQRRALQVSKSVKQLL